MTNSQDNGYKSTANPNADQGYFNSLTYVISQMINRIHTCVVVQVVSVTNTGGVSQVGMVDVQPVVNQTDGYGNGIPHSIIHSLPYFRMQGGANAIILDPQKGDIGVAMFSERDLTLFRNAASQASAATANTPQNPVLQNPGSSRKYSMSDGLYIGGFLNATPTQYVQFNTSGINIVSTTQVELSAPTVLIQCQTLTMNATTGATITTPTLTVNGIVAASGDVTCNSGAHSLAGHHHTVNGVQSGGSNIATTTTQS